MTEFLSPTRVAERYGKTVSTIYRWANEPRFAHLNFPKPIKIGDKSTVWSVPALEGWDAERATLSTGSTEALG